MMISEIEIDAILRGEDVEGLLSMGAPADEYASEATAICRGLSDLGSSSLTLDNVSDLIRRVWCESFGPFEVSELARREGAFCRMARKIINEYKKIIINIERLDGP